MQSPSFPRYLVPPRSKYSPQHHVLKHPQLPFHPLYLLIAIWLIPGGSSTVHTHTQTIHRTTQLTTLVGRLSGIRTQSGQTKINDELTV